MVSNVFALIGTTPSCSLALAEFRPSHRLDPTKLFSNFLSSNPVAFHFQTPSRVLIIPNCMLQLPLKRLRFNQISPFASNNKKFRNDIATERLSRQDSTTGYGGAASVLMLESAAKASMLGTALNYRQTQTFTKVCLDHCAMINENCTPTPHSMRSRKFKSSICTKYWIPGRMLQGVRKLHLYSWTGMTFQVNKDVQLSHLSQPMMEHVLSPQCAHGARMAHLQAQLSQVPHFPSLTMQALGSALAQALRPYLAAIASLEHKLESPGCAEKVPERPSILLPTGEELSPKDINMKKKFEISSENQMNANSPAGDMHVNPAAARGDVTAPKTAAATSATPASPASLNWADSEMAEVDADEGFTVVKSKKRRRVSPSPDHAAKQPSRPAEKRGSQQQKRPTGPRSMPPQEIKATRANIADAKVRQNSTNHENYIFVELCPDIPDYYYLQAIGNLVGGPRKITPIQQDERPLRPSRLVEMGLDIEGTHLKVFPFRKRAERIIIANLPGFVEDSTIVEALRTFGTVTSIAPIMIKMGEYTFNDGRREAFILLHEGVRLETLPTRLTIKSKGDTLSAFLSFGIKCSKCGKQGHRRANCPSFARQNSSPRQAASPTDARPLPPPPPPQQPRKPAPAPATPASPVQPAKTTTEAPAIPSAPHPAEPMDLAQPAPAALPALLAAPRPLEPGFPSLDHKMAVEKMTSPPSTPARGESALKQLLKHIEETPTLSIDWDKLPGLNCKDAQQLLTSETTMKRIAPTLTEEQVATLDKLHETFKASSCEAYSANELPRRHHQRAKSRHSKEEPCHLSSPKATSRGHRVCPAFHLGSGQDLCLGYNAVVLAHPVAISGSGLACVFGPGVAVIQQRVLWPGHIALATIDVHGEEMTAIVVHLAHEPRERNRQLELLAATAAQEEEGACWIIGDFNIRDRGPSSSSLSDALAALLDLAALVDVATQFDAAHLPTRVAMHGDQVESNRLDRILVPAGVLDRVSIYATSHYHLSDHRLVLLQVGPPTTAVSSPTQPRLAAMLRSGLALEHLAGYIRELEEDAAHDDDDGTFWDRWTSIKAGLLAEARSLHDPRHAASDSYVYRARRYIAAQLEASSIRADYPSLPDLAPTTRELSEEDPLHRPDISPSEIANAIEHLPRGKAPGWDGLPCELLVAFNEDFFAEALARVFTAPRCPTSVDAAQLHLPRAQGPRRPVALPSADYRVLAAILHRRLKPHLRTLVPECQTYAVPGRSPSWNIAKVTDAVEEATAMGSPLAVMGIDLESALDSLDRGFLESLMTSLRLPPAFIGWISILYAGADATIRAGGFHTTAFPLLNGLRQGCAHRYGAAASSPGVDPRRGQRHRLRRRHRLLFHRDEEFERVATVLEDFKRASGIAVNLGKSAGLWCGAWRNRGDSPLGASWSTTSIRVLGLDIAPRSSVVHQEQHLLALLESACRRWTPFTRGLSLVGRARAANSLVGSTIQHHLHGYLPSPPTIAKLQARLARFVWGAEHTAWLPAAVMARPVAIGGLGLLDLATQLQLACLKGVQVALRGGRNGFDWLVASDGEAWIRPPPDGTRLQPRCLRLLKLWEEASKILSLNHRAVPTAQLLDLPIIGGCRFLRPPDLLAPARWRGARVRDLIVEEHLIARPTRSALADAAALGAFCRRLTSENAVGFGAESAPSSSSLAAAVVLRDGYAVPQRPHDPLGPTGPGSPAPRRHAHLEVHLEKVAHHPGSTGPHCGAAPTRATRPTRPSSWPSTPCPIQPILPRSAPPVLPAGPSTAPSATVTGAPPLIREAFNIIGRPPDLQAWIFGGSGLEDDALSILASAKLRIYRYFVQVGLGEAVEDPLIAWSRTLQRRATLEEGVGLTILQVQHQLRPYWAEVEVLGGLWPPDGISPLGHLHRAVRALQHACSPQLPLALRVYLAALQPQLDGLDALLATGILHDPHGELVLARPTLRPPQDPSFWEACLQLRDQAAVEVPLLAPAFLEQLLQAGRTRILLTHLGATPASSSPQEGLYANFIRLLGEEMSWSKPQKEEISPKSNGPQPLPELESTNQLLRQSFVFEPPIELQDHRDLDLTEWDLFSVPLERALPRAIQQALDLRCQHASLRLAQSLRQDHQLLFHLQLVQKVYLMEAGEVASYLCRELFAKVGQEHQPLPESLPAHYQEFQRELEAIAL
ncbi:hypothetical protein LAZ67_22001390 [Cordylochernes scorpioides]|uniref:CCHC-type domain-containing protein n=1 Tax=Cordylochernes scorpioides TaxID=51811 RepID=A0ABY6LRG3_9ARAC|nr:hypothetical protein LAZ67_22001390 [Cordylochernes scorpioides]